MAFTDIEFINIQNVLNEYINKRRPPENIRSKLDLAYKIEKQNVIIYEKRKVLKLKEMVDSPVAKATFVLKETKWKIYWQKADQKWHIYEPQKEVKTITAFLKIVDEDKYGCFWG